jgi:hypothetical protein
MGEFDRRLWELKQPPVEARRRAQLAVMRTGPKDFATMALRGVGKGDKKDPGVPTVGVPGAGGKANPPVVWAAFALPGPGGSGVPPSSSVVPTHVCSAARTCRPRSVASRSQPPGFCNSRRFHASHVARRTARLICSIIENRGHLERFPGSAGRGSQHLGSRFDSDQTY